MVYKISFWIAVIVVSYTYILYPAIALMLCKLRGKPYIRKTHYPNTTVVIAAYNEQKKIIPRIENMLQSDYPMDKLNVIVVSDGSTDQTNQLVQGLGRSNVSSLHYDDNRGKAVALNHGVAHAHGDIVLFADARQSFAKDAIKAIVEPFGDPHIGAVTGELIFTTDGTSAASAVDIGLYWKYEKAIRSWESCFDSTIGATGAIFAIRKELFTPLPDHAILDDVITPLRICQQGYRVVHISDALAYDQKSTTSREEFSRKVRTLAGNYEIMHLERWVNFPWNNRLWFQWMSHKVLRLLVPYFLVLLLISSLFAEGDFYKFAAVIQVIVYGLAIIGWVYSGRNSLARYSSVFTTFLVLNMAAVIALATYLFSDRHRLWRKH